MSKTGPGIFSLSLRILPSGAEPAQTHPSFKKTGKKTCRPSFPPLSISLGSRSAKLLENERSGTTGPSPGSRAPAPVQVPAASARPTPAAGLGPPLAWRPDSAGPSARSPLAPARLAFGARGLRALQALHVFAGSFSSNQPRRPR